MGLIAFTKSSPEMIGSTAIRYLLVPVQSLPLVKARLCLPNLLSTLLSLHGYFFALLLWNGLGNDTLAGRVR